MKYTFLLEALIELAPNKAFIIDGEYELKNIVWNENVSESDIPRQRDIIDKCEDLQADYDAKKYQRDRADIYPEIGDQLDMLWHAIDSGTLNKESDFYTTLKKVKDDNPKP
jgi:hypothetical protein